MKIGRTYDADGFGKIVREARGEAGNLIVAWGPDTRDADGQPVAELSDRYWIGTFYQDDDPKMTLDGTRDEVEAWAHGLIERAEQ